MIHMADRTRKSNTDYKIGWICANDKAYTAAQSLLDERHGQPDRASINDGNQYMLGKMGKHNVVLTVLPDGESGTDAAAVVATHLVHSFPRIQFGLMVGTGGGAPTSRHDIRLGDVVVSQPGNGFGGVFAYDFGEVIQGQEDISQLGFLNQPPTILRGAIVGLQCEYQLRGHRFKETIASALERNPSMKETYMRPAAESDLLYDSHTIHHSRSEARCRNVCGLATLVSRRERNKVEDIDPTIHFGLIASANFFMQDALTRDRMAAKYGVLCFEMQAAGLMNSFPCLVICGICNYADTHRNKEWQGYASMTASAYGKDLLQQIAPSVSELSIPLNMVISNLEERLQSKPKQIEGIASKEQNENNETAYDEAFWLEPRHFQHEKPIEIEERD